MIPSVDMPRKSTATASSAKPPEQINFRVDTDLAAALQDGHRLMELLAKVNGDDSPGFSGALRRLLRLGLDVQFNKVGGRPKSESDWAALEATLVGRKTH